MDTAIDCIDNNKSYLIVFFKQKIRNNAGVVEIRSKLVFEKNLLSEICPAKDSAALSWLADHEILHRTVFKSAKARQLCAKRRKKGTNI